MKLGVFDSGIGGEAVAASLRLTFPEADIIVVDDRLNVPYGSKSTEQIIALTDAAIQPLLAARCDIILIACNTATAAAITVLRSRYPAQAFIGFEPMVKPAALRTKTGRIAVCATPSTLQSERYKWLKDTFAAKTTVLEPDCSGWAPMIQSGHINRAEIEKAVVPCLEDGADVIVLACTHYHWLKDMITDIAEGRAVVLEPTEAITRRIRQLIALSDASPAASSAASSTTAAQPLAI